MVIGCFYGEVIDHCGLENEVLTSMQYIPPETLLLYKKTGVCRGIPVFLIFAPKHRLWVLVRTASASLNIYAHV